MKKEQQLNERKKLALGTIKHAKWRDFHKTGGDYGEPSSEKLYPVFECVKHNGNILFTCASDHEMSGSYLTDEYDGLLILIRTANHYSCGCFVHAQFSVKSN